MEARKAPIRKDGRVIIHFDYDAFYAAVFEAENPILKSLPFAVQQKYIIATCNYEARRRGLYKLMTLRDAKRMCPDLIVELGEDLTRFRNASKELYNFIKAFSWESKIERLGFDEVWMDVTSMIDYNIETLNKNDLQHSFFQMSREDPTQGFEFDASAVSGHTYPKDYAPEVTQDEPVDDLTLRLRLGSHLANNIRQQLEQQKGYTSTVGIATNKVLSKLVSSLNKPRGQTTLMPPLSATDTSVGNAISFLDGHEIGKVPGIGFKLGQKLREFILKRPVAFDLVYGGTHEAVTVAEVRNCPEINFEVLEKLLGGPGSPHGIGYKTWCLLHGVDDTEVSQARPVPRQISIEDSHRRLDTMPEVLKELTALSRSLIKRMRIDLLADEDEFEEKKEDLEEDGTDHSSSGLVRKKWLAHPKTLRLTTRPREPLLPDGTRARTMKRISHSCPLPNFVFNQNDSIDSLAETLVRETLLTMFRRLHPEKSGWDLSLMNVAVTNMAEAAGESKTADGRDIGSMFKRQDEVLRPFRVTDTIDERAMHYDAIGEDLEMGGAGASVIKADIDEDEWIDEDRVDAASEFCNVCLSHIPAFAMVAHQRFHSPGTH